MTTGSDTALPIDSVSLTHIRVFSAFRELTNIIFGTFAFETVRSLGNFINSGVYKNIQREVSVASAIASIVVVANAVLGGFTDFEGGQHAGLLADLHLKLALPMTPFTLASPSLGLLLGKYAQSASRSFFCFERPI